MLKLFFILVSSILTIKSFSQQLTLDVRQKKLSDFIPAERKFGNIKFEPNAEIFSGDGIAQPLIFRHKETNIPDRLTYYFFYESDSSIESILYEWDDNNFRPDQRNEKKSDDEISSFIGKYKNICDSISQSYGKSDSNGDLTDRSKIAKGTFEKSDTWKPNPDTEVELYMILSSFYKKKWFYDNKPDLSHSFVYKKCKITLPLTQRQVLDDTCNPYSV